MTRCSLFIVAIQDSLDDTMTCVNCENVTRIIVLKAALYIHVIFVAIMYILWLNDGSCVQLRTKHREHKYDKNLALLALKASRRIAAFV